MTDTKTTPIRAALVGTPNAGKTSLFNALTGGRERTGNYPGVTVEKVSGVVKHDGAKIEILDVPGLYSLRPLSLDEHLALEALTGKDKPDVVIFVLDALNLARGLFLLTQTLECGLPVVAALTMGDLASKEGHPVSASLIAQHLGIPVVSVVAHKGQGTDELVRSIGDALRKGAPPLIDLGWPEILLRKADDLVADPLNPEWSRTEIVSALCGTRALEPNQWTDRLHQAQEDLQGKGFNVRLFDASTRHSWAAMIAKRATQGAAAPHPFTQKLDQILTHKVAGLLIFLAVMYGLFTSIYVLATPLMDGVDAAFGWLGDTVSAWLEPVPFVQELVVDGIIGGVGSAVIFLPQILILFALISVLEASGYLARASFLMDRLLGWCGLNGRAFIPLLSSFACAIPGIMAARVMPDAKSRLATIMVAPLMSCSARLPVYTLLIGAVIQPQFGTWWAGFALFFMHFLGLIVAIPTVWVLNRKVLKGGRLPFVMDLPRYQWPKLRDVFHTVLTRATIFLKTAGTIIVVMSIIIWALLAFPKSDEANAVYQADYAQLAPAQKENITEELYLVQRQRADSFLGRFGRTLEPVFLPAGFDWRITTAIVAAFPAREVVASAMGVLFFVPEDDEQSLTSAVKNATWPDGKPLFTPWNAAGLMVFFALCAQCMSTLAVIKREAGHWKWAAYAFLYMTALAYILAVAIHQVGRLFGA